jgi:hypothetical protein
MYSNVDKTDMIPIYGEFDKNVSAVARFCQNLRNCTANFVLGFLNQETNMYSP